MPDFRDAGKIAESATPRHYGDNSAAPAPTRPARSGSSFEARFGRVILQDGIAAIPSALLHYGGALQLSAQQIWFVSYILAHKWDEDLPYPSLHKMGKCTGMSYRNLQRIKNSLCDLGHLEVHARYGDNQGRETSAYDFSRLFNKLEELVAADLPLPNSIRAEGQDPGIAPGIVETVELAGIDSSFIARFGRLLIRRGVAAVPRAIFTHQAQLRLTPQQVWFITYIFSFQWDTALPYPSIEKMVAVTGYSRSHLHTIKAELVQAGYLRLVHRTNEQGGQDSNAYDFSGLLEAIRALLPPASKQAREKADDTKTGTETSRATIPPRRGRAAAQARATQAGYQARENSRPAASDQERMVPGDIERTGYSDVERIPPDDAQRTPPEDIEQTRSGDMQHTRPVRAASLRKVTENRQGQVTLRGHEIETIKAEKNNEEQQQSYTSTLTGEQLARYNKLVAVGVAPEKAKKYISGNTPNPSKPPETHENGEDGEIGEAGANDAAYDGLIAIGVFPTEAERLANDFSAASIQGWLDYFLVVLSRQENLTNPVGVLVKMIRSGAEPPYLPSQSDLKGLRNGRRTRY